MSKPETMNAQASAAEVERLRGTIRDMNDLASHGFTSVAAIARLARKAIEQPEEQRLLGDIRAALQAIVRIADDIANDIDVTAETEIRQDSAT